MFRPFDFLAPKDFNISWLSNRYNLNIPDAGYTRHIAPSKLFDDGYSGSAWYPENYFFKTNRATKRRDVNIQM